MRNLHFRQKVFACYALLLLLFVSVGFGSVYIYILNRLKTEITGNMELSVKDLTGRLDNTLQQMDNLSVEVAANPFIQEYLRELRRQKAPAEAGNMQDMVSNTLISIAAVNLGSFRISVYNRAGSYTSIGIPDSATAIREKTGAAKFQDWYDGLLPERGSGGRLLVQPDFWGGTDKMISVVREIVDIDTYASGGAVQVQMPVKKLRDLLDSGLEQQEYLISGEGELLYLHNGLPDGKSPGKDGSSALPDGEETGIAPDRLLAWIGDREAGSGEWTEKGSWYLSFRKSENAGWYLIALRPTSVLMQAAWPVVGIALFITAALLVLLLLFTWLSADRLARPIEKLQEETRMLAVQAQMNPHFLFNILSVINALGFEYHSVEIMEICRKLSGMLRYSGDFTLENVRMAQEIEHAENYLGLMQCRFKDKLLFRVEMEAGTEDIRVPKLVIQPIVENCFQHGLKTVKGKWKVILQVQNSPEGWSVRVLDNGAGFEKQTVEELERKLEKWEQNVDEGIRNLGIGGYGLVNVLARMRLCYGERMRFRVDETVLEEERFCVVEIGGTRNVPGTDSGR